MKVSWGCRCGKVTKYYSPDAITWTPTSEPASEPTSGYSSLSTFCGHCDPSGLRGLADEFNALTKRLIATADLLERK